MKNFSLKALGAFIFAAGLVVAGVTAPANASPAVGTITPDTFTAGAATTAAFTFSTGSTNASSVGSLDLKIQNNSNQPITFIPVPGCTTFTTCKITSVKFGATTFTQEGVAVSGKTVTVLGTQGTFPNSQSHIAINISGTSLNLVNQSFEVSFDPGAFTVPSTSGAYTAIGLVMGSSPVEYQAPVTVNASGGGGGGGGSTPSTPATDPTLANTGINSATGISLLAGGLSLALVGAEMFMIARRKRSN